MNTTATRTINGVELPAPGLWSIDPGHADVAFIGRHFGLTKVRGRFTGVAGDVVVGESITDSTVTVLIDMASVNSGDDARDGHLRSDDLFDTTAFPTATFVSTRVTEDGGSGIVTGDLTIKGVTRSVDLRVDYLGHARDPWDNDRAVFSASTSINREDWGLTWNMFLEAGGIVVSKEIKLEIEVELIRQPS